MLDKHRGNTAALRRHRRERQIAKARKIEQRLKDRCSIFVMSTYVHHGSYTPNTVYSEDYPFYINNAIKIQYDVEERARMRAKTMKPCSKACCGNPRNNFKGKEAKTRHELSFEREYIKQSEREGEFDEDYDIWEG